MQRLMGSEDGVSGHLVTDGTGGTLAKQYETTNTKGARPGEQQERTNLLLFVKEYV